MKAIWRKGCSWYREGQVRNKPGFLRGAGFLEGRLPPTVHERNELNSGQRRDKDIKNSVANEVAATLFNDAAFNMIE